MAIELSTPDVDGLSDIVTVLRDWQHEGAPMQLHPGDLGWFWRFGAEATAAAIRTWRRDGRILAIGLLDGRALLRLTMAPDAQEDQELAAHLAEDLATPARGVLPDGRACLETPLGAVVRDVLLKQGWHTDEPWTPLRRDLKQPVQRPAMRVEAISGAKAHERSAVHRAAFDKSTFTDERWRTMAAGPVYSAARCLVGYDDSGNAVAAITVWSAGPGKPGLIEPMGVHRDHRGRGYGTAITVAAAAQLQQMGSSSAIVYTPSANVGGVATYESAGFQQRPVMRDLCRDA